MRVSFCSLSGTKRDTGNLEDAERQIWESNHHDSVTTITSREVTLVGSLKHVLLCSTLTWRKSFRSSWPNGFSFRILLPAFPSEKGYIEKELPNESSLEIKLIFLKSDPK